MTIFLEKIALSLGGKTITFRVRVYNFLGKLLHEKDVKCFGSNVFPDRPPKEIANNICNQIFTNVDVWQQLRGEGFSYQLENGNKALIYPPDGIPLGGRPTGATDKRPRRRKKTSTVEVIEPLELPNETIIDNNNDNLINQ
jgi:hypothetical protein